MVMVKQVKVQSHQYVLFLGHDAGDGEAGQSSKSSQCDPAKFAQARIDIRRFAQFLSSQQVSPSRVICSKFISQLTVGSQKPWHPLHPAGCTFGTAFIKTAKIHILSSELLKFTFVLAFLQIVILP